MVYWVTEKSAIAYSGSGVNSGGAKITSTGRSDGCNDDRIRSRCITKNGIIGGKCAAMIKILIRIHIPDIVQVCQVSCAIVGDLNSGDEEQSSVCQCGDLFDRKIQISVHQ